MRKMVIGVLALGAVLAGCNDNSTPQSSDNANSLSENRKTETDADPTPQTSTGGETETVSPDGTVNGAPQGQ
jgi:hypothetical protein